MAAANVVVSDVRTTDGALITLAVFRGSPRFVLHSGSQDPGSGALQLVEAGPAVSTSERRRLISAFNGGFKLSAGAGGYEQEGHVVARLLPGLASLVIDRSGRADVGVWGSGLPRPGEAVWSVRQNLPPLVLDGQPSASAANWQGWGATLGDREYVARSALGEDASGHIVFAASMSATPQDLAAALADVHVRTGMELDINPEWVQLDVARVPGGPLTSALPGQWRPAGQYLLGWSRDFVTVLA
ncbi:MAG TPA: hypothetical protein VNG13_03835 [Mycobacteriales bacterium]|nr:hypothetical protein [Mycobacteriales bacterium]